MKIKMAIITRKEAYIYLIYVLCNMGAFIGNEDWDKHLDMYIWVLGLMKGEKPCENLSGQREWGVLSRSSFSEHFSVLFALDTRIVTSFADQESSHDGFMT